MAENYVKFNRGSQAAYDKLVNAGTLNNDTLYFITNSDNSKYSIYLGAKSVVSEISNINEIENVLISEGLKNKQVLAYDSEQNKWVNADLISLIDDFQGATESTQGRAGLVPAPAAGQVDLFLRSDGSWAQIETSAPVSPTQVFEATVEDEETVMEALVRAIGATAVNKGDIGVVKKLIYDDKYEYTAYVYNGTAWAAMDGNYSAENVYFDSDFTVTEKIGTVQTLTNGSATLEAKGKSVKQLLAGLFAAPKNPTVSPVTVGITLESAGAKEVGSTVTPKYSVSFGKGSYTYGPDTGITATYVVSNTADSDTKTDASGSFNPITIGDNTSYGVSVTATYTDGAVPVNNLGTEVPELAISGGSKSASSSGKYTGYRNCFYGTLTEKAEILSSDDIRGLNKTNKAVAKGSTVALNIAGGAGVMRIVFAYPATLGDITEVIDKNDSNANIVGAFSQKLGQIEVEGANGYEAIPYKVWIQDLGSAYADNNTYTFKIG